MLTIALLIAQAVANFPALGAGWVPVTPLGLDEYAHFSRHVPNAPDEMLSATKRTCNCDPSQVTNDIEDAFREKFPTAVVRRESVTVCGTNAQHEVVVGAADLTGHKNIDLYAFQSGDSFVMILYSFNKEAASDADEASMQALCPSASPSASS